MSKSAKVLLEASLAKTKLTWHVCFFSLAAYIWHLFSSLGIVIISQVFSIVDVQAKHVSELEALLCYISSV